MSLYTPPPAIHTTAQDKPTLLVCWWATLFCSVIILLRIVGRFIRSERLFREDKVVAFAIVTIWLRMGFVHVALRWGTNNAQLPDDLDAEIIRRKQIASGLVLVSRILYAATLWILKYTILEFFKRLTTSTWTRSHDITLNIIRALLLTTFIAVVVSDLAECKPFNHYWQVLPDPGGQCRQGFAQLITMATCNIITDLALVLFPVPIIVRSNMTLKRKVQLVSLFSLSLGVVGVTLYRVPHIIWEAGSQQYRSLLASVELLFATAAANALVLGSFVRDRGVKKRKFKYGSIAADSMDRSSEGRRPTLHRHWGSDEDLVRDLGLSVKRELRDDLGRAGPSDDPVIGPAPQTRIDDMNRWQFPQRQKSNPERSDDSLMVREQLYSSRSNSTSNATPRRVSFFDVGGLLSDDASQNTSSRSYRDSFNSSIDPLSPTNLPSPTLPASTTGFRRGSQALLQDLGGLLGPFSKPTRSNSRASSGTELQTIPQHPKEPSYDPRDYHRDPILMDPGGLLR